MRTFRVHQLLAVALAAAVSVPAVAEAGRRGGRSGGPRAAPARSHPRAGSGRPTRPRVRDHRGTVRPPRGERPRVRGHRYYWPRYYYGYWPYYGYGYGYERGYYGSYYYGPPATAEVVAAPAPRPRSRAGVGVHLGQLERDGGGTAGVAGLSLRWRAPVFEGEIELGRRVHAGNDVRERSLAATLYLNLGDIDSFHPYLLGGVGALDSDRVFGTIGAGLALPVASRLTLSGDLRAASIGPRETDDGRMLEDAESTFEGRLGLIVDF